MTSLETRPSSNTRFALNESSPSIESSEIRFQIRPDSRENRAQAIFEFEQQSREAKSQSQVHPIRPGIADLLLSAETLLIAGEKNMAAHLVRQALALDSRDPRALRKMLRCLGGQEWEIKQKCQIHKTLTQVEPNFENFAHLGHCLNDAGLYDEALEAYFESTLRVTDESELLFEVYKNVGNIYVRRSDFESAEEAYHKAFALNPDSDVLAVNLGTLQVQKQDWGGARSRFQNAIELNVANDKAWVGLGLCHQMMGDHSMAQAALENALDLCPSNRTAVHLLASWSLQAGEVRSATQRLQDYMATQEQDTEMSLVLIHLFCHQRQYLNARTELERALCWDPSRQDLIQLQQELKVMQSGEVI